MIAQKYVSKQAEIFTSKMCCNFTGKGGLRDHVMSANDPMQTSDFEIRDTGHILQFEHKEAFVRKPKFPENCNSMDAVMRRYKFYTHNHRHWRAVTNFM
jgi:hypothetical protein